MPSKRKSSRSTCPQGFSLREIARRTHRARQTCTKICRSGEIQTKVQQLKHRLLGESDAWLESLNHAITHEMNGALAYKLLQAFGVVPRPEKNVPAEKQNDWESIDPEVMARATALGQIAMERGSSPPPEADELEAQVQKTKVQSERKSRLFDCRDT